MAPRGESQTVAHAGTPPTPFPQVNACDFLFSEPFERSKKNDYVVSSQLVDRIAEDTRPCTEKCKAKRGNDFVVELTKYVCGLGQPQSAETVEVKEEL
jgi:hypothetical protein